MSENQRRIVAAVIAAVWALAGSAQAEKDILGKWRLERAVVAPWAEGDSLPIEKKWIGKTVEFKTDSVKAPGPLACRNARYAATSMPAEGLFQGGLPAPAEAAAQTLGLAAFPVAGVSLTCDTGIFEFHRAGDAVLFALDNVIWTLDRSPGADAAPSSPAGVVYSFLEAHFNGDMGFDEKTVAAKQKWLSHDLKAAIVAYFAKPFPEDEVPPINGDPFTDSQEYPTRFFVGKASMNGKKADVPVGYSDAFSEKTVVFMLVRDGARWRLDDLSYEHGGTFTGQLAATP